MKYDISLNDLNRRQRESEAWLRKFKSVSRSDRVEDHQNLVDICKLARDGLLSNDVRKGNIHVRGAQSDAGKKLYEFLVDPKNFTDPNLTLETRLSVAGIPTDFLNYHDRFMSRQPNAEALVAMLYSAMILAAEKVN
jgi:hypothetical protein